MNKKVSLSLVFPNPLVVASSPSKVEDERDAGGSRMVLMKSDRTITNCSIKERIEKGEIVGIGKG